MNGSPDLTIATLKMVLSLGAVLLILWAAHRWLRRFLPSTGGAGRNRWIKVLGMHPLGIKKSIAMVQVPGSILVLGIGTEQVQLLTRIDDPEVMAEIAEAQVAPPGGTSFADHLKRMSRSLGLDARETPICPEEKGARR